MQVMSDYTSGGLVASRSSLSVLQSLALLLCAQFKQCFNEFGEIEKQR